MKPLNALKPQGTSYISTVVIHLVSPGEATKQVGGSFYTLNRQNTKAGSLG